VGWRLPSDIVWTMNRYNRFRDNASEVFQHSHWKCITGLPVVLKFLKFHSCPEIVLKFYSFGQSVLIWTFVMLSLQLFTSHDYVYVADVECQVMFSLVTLYCFMCNIAALVTFVGLQYWSASMINIYEHRKTCIFCVLSLVKPTTVSWNFLKSWSWNFTSCCWEPWHYVGANLG